MLFVDSAVFATVDEGHIRLSRSDILKFRDIIFLILEGLQS